MTTFVNFVNILEEVKKATESENQKRRTAIIEAALDCFLNHGYAKTSMNDVAKKTNLSRPLLYLNFNNKVDLLQAIYRQLTDGRIERAESAMQNKSSRKARLTDAVEILIIEPWERVSGYTKSLEFFETCGQYNQKNYEYFEQKQLKLLQSFFEDKIIAEVFTLAVNGTMEDLPSTSVLKKRLAVLVEKFI